MDVNTGKVVSFDEWMRLRELGLHHGYQALPPELEEDAGQLLRGQPDGQVDLEGGSRLAQWAAEQRRLQRQRFEKTKRRREMANASKARNRR